MRFKLKYQFKTGRLIGDWRNFGRLKVMIQDILPRKFNNVYYDKQIKAESVCIAFKDTMILVGHRECDNGGVYKHIIYDDGSPDNSANDMEMFFPDYKTIAEYVTDYTYLFSIEDEEYFLVNLNTEENICGFEYENYKTHRHVNPKYRVFAEMTAFHLYTWYRNNYFCGKCG